MNLYDALIQESLEMVQETGFDRLSLSGDQPLWETEEEQRLIFQKDMAYELGGNGLPAVSGLAFTSRPEACDQILLCGPDLPQLQADSPYARLTLIHVDDRDWQDNQRAYQILRRIEYTRYHVYPKGFMMRISTSAGREPVRISREALQKGLDFTRVGRLFLRAYHQHPEVSAVTLLFITAPDFPYDRLTEKTAKMETVTSSLDKLLNHLDMDCSACSIKPLCDEIEGLRLINCQRIPLSSPQRK